MIKETITLDCWDYKPDFLSMPIPIKTIRTIETK